MNIQWEKKIDNFTFGFRAVGRPIYSVLKRNSVYTYK